MCRNSIRDSESMSDCDFWKKAWLPHDGIQNIILNDLGYEDVDELEDALGGTFMQVYNLSVSVTSKLRPTCNQCPYSATCSDSTHVRRGAG